ncbi:MAG: hypothetical protein Kow0069_32540 [Promethearchaeota archaeon]
MSQPDKKKRTGKAPPAVSFTIRVEPELKESLQRTAEVLGVKVSALARSLLQLGDVVKVLPRARIHAHDNTPMMLVPRALFFELLNRAAPNFQDRVHYAYELANFVKSQERLRGAGSTRDRLDLMEKLGWFEPLVERNESRSVLVPRDFSPGGHADFVQALFYRLETNKSIPTLKGTEFDLKKFPEWRVDGSSPTHHFRIPALRLGGGGG